MERKTPSRLSPSQIPQFLIYEQDDYRYYSTGHYGVSHLTKPLQRVDEKIYSVNRKFVIDERAESDIYGNLIGVTKKT